MLFSKVPAQGAAVRSPAGDCPRSGPPHVSGAPAAVIAPDAPAGPVPREPAGPVGEAGTLMPEDLPPRACGLVLRAGVNGHAVEDARVGDLDELLMPGLSRRGPPDSTSDSVNQAMRLKWSQ